ncbi:hypothetical protein DXG03_004623 [Asterophora parasitica]|uniref:Uncharacterized protein n=1 Tax=Asterophora parasitica TaxID=117018 RepID=A0A9P7KFM6_9AGAR|nr:hypothetical protein DXG03_004623 [Asterophora parasitica]
MSYGNTDNSDSYNTGSTGFSACTFLFCGGGTGTGAGDSSWDESGAQSGGQYGQSGQSGGAGGMGGQQQKPGIGDKMRGGMEKAAGKMTKNPDLVERGQERSRGSSEGTYHPILCDVAHGRPASRLPVLVLRVLKFVWPIEVVDPNYDMLIKAGAGGG